MENNKPKGKWLELKDRIGHRRVIAVTTLLIIGLLSLSIHGLFIGGLGQSALLYMFVPYSISLLIAAMLSDTSAASNGKKYLRHMGIALLVFLASSIVLREGFVCVIFFFPIYFLIVSLAYILIELSERNAEKKNTLRSIAVPALIVLLSFEGVSDLTTLERNSTVQVRQVTSLSVEEIKENLAKPFTLDQSRHWLLSIFPMPYHIQAGSLNVGDIHKIKTRYQRWFVTNTHIGEAHLLIEHVGKNTVSTKILSDTTYFSSYLKMHGTQIEFTPLESGGTEIMLKIDYERKLDPAWYFHPLQKMAVSKMADFLIQEIMVRDTPDLVVLVQK